MGRSPSRQHCPSPVTTPEERTKSLRLPPERAYSSSSFPFLNRRNNSVRPFAPNWFVGKRSEACPDKLRAAYKLQDTNPTPSATVPLGGERWERAFGVSNRKY